MDWPRKPFLSFHSPGQSGRLCQMCPARENLAKSMQTQAQLLGDGHKRTESFTGGKPDPGQVLPHKGPNHHKAPPPPPLWHRQQLSFWGTEHFIVGRGPSRACHPPERGEVQKGQGDLPSRVEVVEASALQTMEPVHPSVGRETAASSSSSSAILQHHGHCGTLGSCSMFLWLLGLVRRRTCSVRRPLSFSSNSLVKSWGGGGG